MFSQPAADQVGFSPHSDHTMVQKQYLAKGSCVEEQNLVNVRGQRSEWADRKLI